MLSKECLKDIDKYTCPYWVEYYHEELFDRWADINKLDEEERDEIGTGDNTDRYEEFIDWCVEVYIGD